jgi:hypothetical protein
MQQELKEISLLPQYILESNHLTVKDLSLLAQLNHVIPINSSFKDVRLEALTKYMKGENLADRVHAYAKELIDDGKIAEAWQVLLHGREAEKKHLLSAKS